MDVRWQAWGVGARAAQRLAGVWGTFVVCAGSDFGSVPGAAGLRAT